MKLDPRLFTEARRHHLKLIATIGLGAASGVLLVIHAWAFSQAIARVFIDHQSLAQVTPLLWLSLILLALRALAAWGSAEAAGRMASAIKHALRIRLLHHLMGLGPIHLADERTGDLSALLTEGVDQLDAYFRQYIPRLALAALIPLTLLIVVVPIDLLSGVVLILTAPLIPIFMILIGSAAGAVSRKRWLALSRLSAHFLDVLQGLPTLKIFGQSRAQIDTIGTASERFRSTTMEVLRIAFLSAFALEMIGTISTAVVALQLGLRLLFDAISYREALFVLILAPEFFLPMRELGMSFHAASSGAASADRIFQVLSLPVPETPPVAHPLPTRTSIEFDAVSVEYHGPSGTRGGLDAVSFTINEGERVAVVGAVGAGKTTLARLLLGFMPPDSGRILIGGIPLSSLAIEAWRAQIAWVPQFPTLFPMTLAENIRLGRPNTSHDEIVFAAQLAHVHTFIRELPQGYDTVIGERGTRLSGGQAQRIALARAFLIDARLVILDEATTHLDAANRHLICESIDKLLHGRSALIITHDLDSLPEVDRVLVFGSGHLIESGTPDALMRSGGAYSALSAAYD